MSARSIDAERSRADPGQLDDPDAGERSGAPSSGTGGLLHEQGAQLRLGDLVEGRSWQVVDDADLAGPLRTGEQRGAVLGQSSGPVHRGVRPR